MVHAEFGRAWLMRRSIALVAAVLTLSLGLLAAVPAEAGGKHGNKHGFKHGYGHGAKHAYAYRRGHGHKRSHGHRNHGYRSYGHRGFSDSTLLATVGIVAGAEVVSAYLQRPPAYQPAPAYAPVYAAPVRQPTCYQVMVPYVHPYGGYYYAPQVQCY
jgi:hypothetical protein